MPRWYGALQRAGKPETVVQQVAALVRQHDLRTALPLLRVEKRARGQFWVFLAFDSDAPGKLPTQLGPLREHPLIRDLLPGPDGAAPQPFTLEDIRSMVTGEVSVQDYARRLRVVGTDASSFSDPFPGGDDTGGDGADDLVEQSQRFDRLLLWLSAAGAGSRGMFYGACLALGLATDSVKVGRVLRRLRLLGHVESSADGEQWSVAPAVLAEVPSVSGEKVYALSGERDTALLTALHQVAAVEISPQPGGAAPARVLVRTENPHQLTAWLDSAALGRPPRLGRPGASLAELLLPIDRWQSLLSAVPGVRPEMYDLRIFTDDGFVPVAFNGSGGLYELWPRSEREGRGSRPDSTLLYDAEQQRWLRGDWYGLHYLARRQQDLAAPARYNILSGSLAIACLARPPEIYERALVLCSGRLPEQRGEWLHYDDIEPSVLTAVAARLGLTLEEN